MTHRAEPLFAETDKLPQPAKDALWAKLTAERGKREPFQLDDPHEGVLALALLRDKVLDKPNEWSSDDWKFVLFYGFQGCLEQPKAREDACWVLTRIIAGLPRLDDNGSSFLEELEKAGSAAVAPLRAELERPGFALRVPAYELLLKLDPSAPSSLSGVSDAARALIARIDELVQQDKTWRGESARVIRALGASATETVREAGLKAAERQNDSSRYYTPIALGLGLAWLDLDAGRPLSAEARSTVLAELDYYTADEIEAVRALMLALDDETREQLLLESLANAKNGGEHKRCMQIAHISPKTLPSVVAVLDTIQIGKYDAYKKTNAIRTLAEFGPSVAKELAADLGARSSVAAEAIVTVLGDFADAATAPALVEALGHGAKTVRLAAAASLKRLGAAARPALEAGGKSKKKAVRDTCTELLASASAEPSAASTLDEAQRTAIRAALEAAKKSEYEGIARVGREHGAAAMAVAQDWMRTAGAEDYNTRSAVLRLLTFAQEKDPAGATAAFVRTFAELPKLSSYAVRELSYPLRNAKAHAVAPLVAALKGPAFPLRTAAFEALVEIEPNVDRELLLAALADASKEVRTLAAQCLERAAGDLADVAPLLAHKSADVRAAAATLLGKVPTPAARPAIDRALAAEKKPEIAALLEKALVAAGGVAAAAPPSGDDTEESIVAMLEKEKLARMPKFLSLEAMPKLELRSGRALSEKAMTALVTRLMNEGPDQEDALARRARPFFGDASAQKLSEALREAWANDKRDAKHKWAIYQQGILADDARLNYVGPRLDDLVSGGQHHLAGWYADVLYRHSMRGESTTGLSWLAHWSRAAETRSLRSKARELLEHAAKAKGTTVQQLEGTLNAYVADDVADANIATLGFDKGLVELDFGPRKLTVRVGADLKPEVVDESGAAHDRLPAPKKSDDASKAEEAKETFGRLKKQLGYVFGSETKRLEQAMISGRPWSAAAFRKLFLEHPLMKLLGERIVFSATRGAERVLFRVAEGEPVAADYAKVSLADDVVRIAHPLEMSAAEVELWGNHFADIKTVGPFRQLGRPVYARGEELVPKSKVAPGTLAGRVRGLGWRNATPEDAGMVYGATKTFGGRGVRAVLSHEGYHVSDNSWSTDPVGLSSVSFTDLAGRDVAEEAVDPIVFSEVVGDVRQMVDA